LSYYFHVRQCCRGSPTQQLEIFYHDFGPVIALEPKLNGWGIKQVNRTCNAQIDLKINSIILSEFKKNKYFFTIINKGFHIPEKPISA